MNENPDHNMINDPGNNDNLMDDGKTDGQIDAGSNADDSREEEKLHRLRHTCAHILAHAVTELYPGTHLGVGPAIENGFYYDLDVPVRLTDGDLPLIEERMRKIVKENLPLVRKELTRDEAKEIWRDDPFKLELLDAIPEDELVSAYYQGSFVDLCRGPHMARTGNCKHFKLTGLAGAYWRGDEHNPMLQRIYGVAFNRKEELDAHLLWMEEAKKRDHRRLGRELDLFSTNDSVGPGLVLWHPKGAVMRSIIEQYLKDELVAHGYQPVVSPHVARLDLWHTSGHSGFYKENMFQPMEVEGQLYQLKPMNCPFHISIYKSAMRSYRDLPIRYSELGTVYRYERSGVLHGTMRVRGFTQDDAHIFCTPDQVHGEVLELLSMAMKVLRTFGFTSFSPYLATRPAESVGEQAMWDLATDALARAITESGMEYKLDEGGGAFYGPKIDLKIKDSLGREWQLTTIQFDFNLPERFKMSYVAPDGTEQQPIMVHRAILGSLERFFGILVEHYGGAFPVWLAPVQVRILPISEKFLEPADKLYHQMLAAGIRAELDTKDEKLGNKIRRASVEKIPYMAILGEQEAQNGTVTVRKRGGGDLGTMAAAEFIQMVSTENRERKVD